MHLKNFSLITRHLKTELTPAYDMVNTTIALKEASEEIALPLKGKKRNLTRHDFTNYFGKERLQLNDKVITGILNSFLDKKPRIEETIRSSFLKKGMQEKYLSLLNERFIRLQLA